jgi:hypothetical protein
MAQRDHNCENPPALPALLSACEAGESGEANHTMIIAEV